MASAGDPRRARSARAGPPGAARRSCQLQAVYQTAGAFLVKVEPNAAGAAALLDVKRQPAAGNPLGLLAHFLD